MLFRSLRRLVNRWGRHSDAVPARHLAPRFRPRLEGLEDRNLLSTYIVDHLADDMVGSELNGSLRYAITNATNGDSITFGVQGTITLTGGELAITKNLTISGPGTSLITLSGNQASRVFNIAAAFTVTISGLTIANGYAVGNGGGILNAGTLTLTNVTVSDNTSAYSVDGSGGGGIYTSGPVTVTNCIINGNTTWGQGGGIDNVYATVTVTDSTIANNQTATGVGSGGGGIYIYGDGGGAGTLVVNGCTISGNTTDAGGAFFNNFGTLVVNRSTLSGNSGMMTGGGIYNLLGMATVSDSTVSGNHAGANGGGGIYNLLGTLQAQNTIIAGNTSPYAPDLYGDLVDQGYNLIGGNPDLGPLQDNGGPTQTMALLAGSPALNAGDPTQLGIADQRGVVRSGGVNIGAYQASAATFVLTAPATAMAGIPFDVIVTAADPFGQVALGYTGTVTFSTSDPDPGVVLPADYVFQASDGGSHTFPAGVTLVTPGTEAVTVTDTVSGITGSVTVPL
jgi:hypothetical protein